MFATTNHPDSTCVIHMSVKRQYVLRFPHGLFIYTHKTTFYPILLLVDLIMHILHNGTPGLGILDHVYLLSRIAINDKNFIKRYSLPLRICHLLI